MRAIDADGLKKVFKEKSTEAVCGVELCKAIISQIDNQPTVDAIPVEWIKKRMLNVKDTMLEVAYSVLILEWEYEQTERAENETDAVG